MDKQVEDFLKLNSNNYRKYSPGKVVDKVFNKGKGALALVEFTQSTVYVNDWLFNKYDLRNLMKVIKDNQKIEYVHLGYPKWYSQRTLSNAKGSEMLKKWWKYKKETEC